MLKHKIPSSAKEVLVDAIKGLPVVGSGLSIILEPAFDSAIRLVDKKIVEHEKRQGNGD